MFNTELAREQSPGVAGVGQGSRPPESLRLLDVGDAPAPVVDGLAPADWPEQEWLLASLTASDAPPPEPPSSLAERDPSGWLALDLDVESADPGTMSDSTLIDATIGWDRVASWALARQAKALAEFARRRPGDDPQAVLTTNEIAGSEWAPDEVGMALRVSRGAARVRLDQAARFVELLPETLDLLERGRLDGPKARAICDAVAFLDPELAVAVQDRVLARAPESTLAQLRALLARALIAVDPRGAAERHREARRQRMVRLSERDDGMASLWALLSAPDAMASYELLTRLARSLGADDPRGMDARRADLLVDLLTGRLDLVDAEQLLDDASGPDPTANDPAADNPAANDPTGSGPPVTEPPGGSDSCGSDPCGSDPTGSDPTGSDPTGSDPTGSDPTGSDPTGSDPTGSDPTGDDPVGGSAGRVGDVAPTAGRRPARAPVGKPLVHVIVPYSTLIGADDEPCELAGYGPIPADLAREIAADGVWKRLVTDPLSGALLDHGRTTYRPPAALAEFVRARDVRCRSPICRRQAVNCELDHAIAWADGGPTAEHNMWAGCVHDHHLKHRPGWTVSLLLGGSVEWITPTGHHYVTDPHDYRPVGDPDPPLLHRPPGKDPVPEQLRASPVKVGPGRAHERPLRRLDAETMFGCADPIGPPPHPGVAPPF